ncbi:hypothetical protein J6590_010261 [Homalodisca vitripennis]|nr:hypothetical protein J6590_010261 [Homalodisca vitripennis]
MFGNVTERRTIPAGLPSRTGVICGTLTSVCSMTNNNAHNIGNVRGHVSSPTTNGARRPGAQGVINDGILICSVSIKLGLIHFIRLIRHRGPD